MEKKTYLTPTTTVYALYQEDGILLDGSARGKLLFDDGGKSSESKTTITEGDTKSEGQWDDFWDSLVN